MIIISPYSRKLRNGKENAKNYPWWEALLEYIIAAGHEVVQVGIQGEQQLVDNFRVGLSLKDLKSLIKHSSFWISVDNFFPHLANTVGKRGVVLWSISDPLIFGYERNLNILKGREYLRKSQFATWEEAEYNIDAFVDPIDVYKEIITNRFL